LGEKGPKSPSSSPWEPTPKQTQKLQGAKRVRDPPSCQGPGREKKASQLEGTARGGAGGKRKAKITVVTKPNPNP